MENGRLVQNGRTQDEKVYFIRVSEGSNRAIGGEEIFEEVMAKNFMELMKDTLDFKEISESQVE